MFYKNIYSSKHYSKTLVIKVQGIFFKINRLVPDVTISIPCYSEVPANAVSLQKMETIKTPS